MKLTLRKLNKHILHKKFKSFCIFFLFVFLLSQLAASQPSLPPLLIAVIDTGIDIEHPHLQNVIWSNNGEIGLDTNGTSRALNGIDDDKNGFVDDVHGWNFANANSDISDGDGHGTHIAGIIKNTTLNSPRPIKILPIKYYENIQNPGNNKNSFLDAIKYAIEMKADIINISGGGLNYSRDEFSILSEATQKGIIVVAAAGNKFEDNEYFAFYPAAYQLPGILSVVAADESGLTLSTSNINIERRNILVLGKKIYSSLPHKKFGFKTGSSQATAVLSGKIASHFETIKKINLAHLDELILNSNF